MGFLDVLIGRRKLAKPAPDRLFAMSTAYVTLETSLEITSRGSAAIVFQPLATADFEAIVRDMEEVVQGHRGDSGTAVETTDDSYGFSWLVLRGGTSTTSWSASTRSSSALEAGGYGERVLCAVFAFEDSQQAPAVLDLQLQARLLLPVRPRRRRPAARQRARARAQGADRLRAPGRAGARPLVPAVGDPDLSPPRTPPRARSRPAPRRPTPRSAGIA